jgi:hypothetical protein
MSIDTIGRQAETWTRDNGVFSDAEAHYVRTVPNRVPEARCEDSTLVTDWQPQSSRTTTIEATKQNHPLPRVTVAKPREDLKQTAYRLV